MYTDVLKKVYDYGTSMGFKIQDSNILNGFFKGDMDGLHIWTSSCLDDESELFNVLHMLGHSIQWNLSKELRELGNVLYNNPDDQLLRRLQEYEWEANCYALYILHKVGVTNLDDWLYDKYIKDMYYLTHFYKTGQKLRHITPVAMQYAFIKELVPKEIPLFTPYANIITRDGIVINFHHGETV